MSRFFSSMSHYFSFALCSILLVACDQQASAPADATATNSTATPESSNTVPSMTDILTHFNRDEVAADVMKHTKVLASDEFEGRAPATKGEELTIAYLEKEFKDLGLQPGNNGSYFQTVPVTEITTDPNTTLHLQGGKYSVDLAYGKDMMVGTQQQIESVAVKDSDLVFVGFGIVAPERNWNDYAGIDVKGKTVVILVNDPGYHTQDPALFNGNAMTYYGRWTYKYEEAARQGAAAALIVHETGAAGYGWDVVSNSWSGPQITLKADNLNADKNKIEGWLTLDSAKNLFSAVGMDYEAMKKAATQPGFKAVPMGELKTSVAISNSIRHSESQNVIAILPGSDRPDETIVYTAHWDHLGKNPNLEGDQIFNGAIDNATGTAGLLALARQFTEYPEPPKRTIVFLAVTAEESGLLGSQWYGENPIYPLSKTVANINMDALGMWGEMKDIVVIGYGSSELEKYLQAAADATGRYLSQEPTPERGYFYRSDHFNFAKHGVPALYAEGGNDHIEKGKSYGEEKSQEYTDKAYHQPADEFDPNWDPRGAVADLALHFAVGYTLSQESSFPNWYEGNEFKGIRDQSQAVRAE